MSYLTFKFATYIIIIYHDILFIYFPILSSIFVKKKNTIRSDLLLKSGIDCELSFRVAIFSTQAYV